MHYLFMARYAYKIARFLVVAIIMTYFIACLWYFVITGSFDSDDQI